MKKGKEFQTEGMVNFKITKSNEFIQKSRYSLPNKEQKIIAYIVSQIEPEDTDFQPYTFDIKNFSELCGIEPRGAYKSLKDAIKKLADRSFWYKDEEKGEEVLLRWISSAKISKDKGRLEITISPDMKPFLLNLKERFTTYSYYNILLMTGQYSPHLFDILKSYEQLKGVGFYVDDFRHVMCAENYTEYKELKRRCILPALEEINAYTDISVTLEELKKGRKVYKIYFKIKSKNKIPAFFQYREEKQEERKKLK